MEWSVSTPYSLAVGYKLQVNSIQLLRADSILANGGYLVEPTLIRKIVKKESDHTQHVLVDHTLPERLKKFPRVLSPKIVNEVVKAMKFTTKPGGTAPRADIKGYTEAGKTSTSKKIENGVYAENLYRASFIGFTPVKNAAFVLIVTMDEPEYGFLPGVGKTHHGGTCTAPVFREIAKRSLEYLGIPPDDPYGYASGDPRTDLTKADWMNETRQLQEMYQKWNNKSEHK
jgi:cell division protein FtsI (penicillin-binding protein 3)